MTKNLFYSISFCFRQISHRSKSPCNRCNEIGLIHFNQKKIWDGWEANHCRISARQTFEQQFCETVDVHCTNEFVCVHRIFIAEQDRQKTRKNVPKQNFNMIWRNDYENKTRTVCACLKLKKKYIMLQETGSQSASLIADIKDDKIKFRCKMLFT